MFIANTNAQTIENSSPDNDYWAVNKCGYNAVARKFAVPFTTPSGVDIKITQVEVLQQNADFFGFYPFVRIETASGFFPSNIVVTNGTSNLGSCGTGAIKEWIPMTYSPGSQPILSANTTYFLVLAGDATSSLNYAHFRFNNIYENGLGGFDSRCSQTSACGSESWVEPVGYADDDLLFIITYETVAPSVHLTFNTCDTTFYDSGGPAGDYSDNENDTITFCSTNSSCIRAIIEYYDLEFNYDTLFIYDGNTITGTPIAALNYLSSYDNLNATGTSYFAQSGCITFHFVSDISTVKAGWEIRIDCPDNCVAPVCTGSEPANDDCSFSTPICNLNGLCGSTAGTIDHPEINTDPDDSTSLDIFCGIINNNTWLSFIADAPIAVLDVWVYNCGLDLYFNISGIQIQVYETDCNYGNFIAKSNCWSPVEEITGQIIATDLTPGNEYLIMMDGFADSECDFTFAASTGVIVADAGNDKTICEGESTSLTASGGISFLWSASPADASLSGQENNQTINVSPTETTTYTVTVTGDLNPNCPGTADVVVFVNAADASFTGLAPSYCEDDATVYPLTGYPVGGTFNPGNTFNPSVAGAGSHNITYTYEYSVVITFEDDFDPAPLPGWTHGVISGGEGDSWETGNPKGGNGQNSNPSSNPDPFIDHSSNTDNNVYGQGLGSGIGDGVGGHYDSSIEWLKSPAIDCSALSNTTLSFWRSANFEDIYDKSKVKISTDDITWIDLLEPLFPQDEEWVQRIINISDYADGESTVYISWLSYSDISQTYSGWNIDDVTITGVQQGGSCTSVDLQTTTVYPLPTSFFNVTSPPCFDSTAAITYTGSASAGAAYTWNFDGGTIVSGSEQGPYEIFWATSQDYNVSLQVTEYDCISALTTNIVTVPTQLSLTPSYTNSSCGNSDGSASVSVTGGTMPYSYFWTTSGTDSSITNISSGSYTVTVTDNNGCTESIIINITDEDGPSASITDSSNVSCYNECDGSATVTASGGTEPYTYDWSSGGNQLTENNLCAGIYTVAVTDSNSCIATASVTITEPEELTANITGADVLCNGGSDGTANLSVSGGTQDYSYLWNYGQTTQNLSNIAAGPYEVTVTDANSCTATASIIIYEPDELFLSGEAQDANCGSDDGSATVNVTGGTAPYSYLWSDDMNQTTQTATGLSYGDYTVTVTDNNGCFALLIVNVGNQGGGTANIAPFTNILCFGDANGEATVTMTGGTPDYTYIWSTGDTTVTGSTSNTISGLSSAPYYVTITDAKGCIATANVTITEPDELMANITGTDIQCYEGADGAANLTVSGGTPSYSYLWNYGQISQDLNNLAADTYEVTVTDANNCFTSASVIIAEPTEIVITYITTSTSCMGNNDGSITLMVDGGIPPYQYEWSTEPVQTDSVATQLTEGTYQVTVTDDNSCNAFKEFEVKGSAETCLEIPSAFTPNNDNINDKWEIRHIDLYQKVTIEIYNRWGVIIFEYNGTGAGYSNSQWDGTSKKGKELPFGSYVYIINLHNEIEAINGIVTIIR